jgi:hypothetical protein
MMWLPYQAKPKPRSMGIDPRMIEGNNPLIVNELHLHLAYHYKQTSENKH